MYSAATNQVKKTISRFHQSAYNGCFRHDGQLLAAGSEEGVVKVCIWPAGRDIMYLGYCCLGV